jgi:hypothetical protein
MCDQDRAVEMRLPADDSYVAVLRAVAADVAGQYTTSTEAIDDVRCGVEDAVLSLVRLARPASELECVLSRGCGGIRATLGVDGDEIVSSIARSGEQILADLVEGSTTLVTPWGDDGSRVVCDLFLPVPGS